MVTRHLVVGAGEVGSAIHAVLDGSDIRDIAPSGGQAEVLHVCIPWSDDFVEIVEGYEAEHATGLVVVHSTVPVGTCDPQRWVHSPVRGRHPDLEPAVRGFVKHFGGGRADEAAAAFAAAGVPTALHPRAADTEAGKLWELIQYGVQIRVEKQIHAWCEEHGLDFDVVYRQMAETYNAGWVHLGHPEFVRPVLEHVSGPIGGHCVTQNAGLIAHPLADLVTGEAAVLC